MREPLPVNIVGGRRVVGAFLGASILVTILGIPISLYWSLGGQAAWLPGRDDVGHRSLLQEYDVCIAGAGLSGAVIAERYASQLNQAVIIIEKRDHIGGNCYDYVDEDTGIRVSQYGAHLFHTRSERVWEYVHRFSKWTKYEHEVVGVVNGTHVPIPVNIQTVNSLFGLNITTTEQMDRWLKQEQVTYDHAPTNSEEMALSRVGHRLYELIFHPYTIKQWDKEPRELGPEVTARIPVRNNNDNRYFGDRFQALPTNGYTAFFRNLLCHPNIELRLKTDYFKVRDSLKCRHTYFTGPIDAYFAHLGHKKLEYRSLDFERRVVYNTGIDGFFQPKFVVNHPAAATDFTRIVEYKHLLNQTSNHTILFVERSKAGGEPYYPIPNDENKALYAKYQDLAGKEEGVSFVGRLANYKYFNMDEAILNALKIFDNDNNRQYTKGERENESGTYYTCAKARLN
jgi:UDP-galactopyranose mutase